MLWRLAISRRRSLPLLSTVTSMQPVLTCFGKPTSLTPVHTGGMRASWSQTRNLVVSICKSVGAGEDGTGGWKCHQRQPLDERRYVNEADFGSPWHPQSLLKALYQARPPADRRCPARPLRPGSRVLSQSPGEMLTHPNRIRHRSKRGVHRTDADEEAGVDNIQIVEFMSFTVDIENRACRVPAESAGSRLMSHASLSQPGSS
jgi:hypothetical protein